MKLVAELLKEFLGNKRLDEFESVDFQRGQDPKSSIGIGMEQELKKFLKEVRPRSSDSDRSYWLNLCAEKGRNDLVKYLLSKGFPPDMNNGAPLQLAASHGNMDVVKTLLDAGANPNNKEFIPFVSALLNGNYDIAEYLLQRGAKYSSSWDTFLDQRALEYPLIRAEWERAKMRRQMNPNIIKKLGKNRGVSESIDFHKGGNPLDTLKVGRIEERKNAAYFSFMDWLTTYQFKEADVIEETYDKPYGFIGDEYKEKLIFNGLTVDEISKRNQEEEEKYFKIVEKVFELTFWAAEIAKLEYEEYKTMSEEDKEELEEKIEDDFGSYYFLTYLVKYFIEQWPGEIKIKNPYESKTSK